MLFFSLILNKMPPLYNILLWYADVIYSISNLFPQSMNLQCCPFFWGGVGVGGGVKENFKAI